MNCQLTVITPDKATFINYFYGYGRVTNQMERPDGHIETIVDYGEDHWRCEYQAARFASGLYFAKVTD